MRYGPYLIALIFFACLPGTANAQQQLFKNYSVNDGLVANPVRRIFQDRKGFIWIGTWEGLSKYDGYSFTNYTTANGLSHNLVNDFYESGQGQLYVSLNNGTINQVSGDGVINATDSSGIVVNTIVNTPWHTLLAATDNKGILEIKNGRLFRPKQSFPAATIIEIKVINDTSIVVSGEGYIQIYNKDHQLMGEASSGFNEYSDIKIYQDTKKRIWAGCSKGLRLLSTHKARNKTIGFAPLPSAFRIPALTNAKINAIFEDVDSVLWFATTGGIVKINTDGSSQVITTRDGLSGNMVNTIFQDKEKNIWFGTETGLSKLVTRSGIRLYPIENGVAVSDNVFLLYSLNKDNFLVSTSKGVEVFDKRTGALSPISNSSKQEVYFSVTGASSPTFIGFRNLLTLDTEELRFRKKASLPLPSVSRMAIDKAGNHFSGDLNHFFVSTGKGNSTIIQHRVSALLVDKAGDLWTGTWANGLYRVRAKASAKGMPLIDTTHFLPNENIRCLYNDSQGNIWVGTRYHGLFLLAKNNNDSITIFNFDQRKGLSSNFIKGVREDKNGNFWIAFYNGLDKLIKLKDGFRVFNFSQVNHFFTKTIGLEIDTDNAVWLATGDGLVKITDAEMDKIPPLPVYITKVYSPDTSYGLLSKNLALNYKQNQLQFQFSAPGYINERQVFYSYRLNSDATAPWSAATSQHEVSFASLQPANYRFEVRTLGWNGAWGEPAGYNFTVHPPFWKTGWFISAMALGGFLLIYFFTRWRIKNIKTIAAEKLKVQQLNAAQYKSQLELEQIINYFSSSLVDKNKVEEVLWDVAKNLISRLGFVDCMMYLWNSDKSKMIQVAGFGPKGSVEALNKQHLDVLPGQGVVGYVMQTKEAVLINDTATDSRYRADEIIRLSEITVPIIYNNELIGIIDSEHAEKNFFTARHLQVLNTIATLMANKIKSIDAELALQQTAIEMYSMNEQLTKAKLAALQSQMNPHFIFNCLNSIDNLIQMDEKERATAYLAKFAKLIRSILENAASNTIPCWKDMETLTLYLELEALRFDYKFQYRITIPDHLLNGDYKVPPLLIQPFIENAIHHGLLSKKGEDKQLQVDVNIVGQYIQYIIQDNGVGRKKAAEYKSLNKPLYASMGIKITAERINIFNQQSNGSVKITDLIDNRGGAAGTRVEVNLLNQP